MNLKEWQEFVDLSLKHLPNSVGGRKGFVEACRTKVSCARAFLRGHGSKLYVQYVRKHTADGSKGAPVGVLVAFPVGERIYLGGSRRHPRDKWNKYVGQWRAILNSAWWIESVLPESMQEAGNEFADRIERYLRRKSEEAVSA